MKILGYIVSLPIRVLLTIIFIIVIVSLGIGWGVIRATNNPDEQSPATTVEAITPPTTSPTNATPAPLAQPTATPVAAATFAPAATPLPPPTAATAGESTTVQAGEGLFMVCRRHCQGRWPPDDDALSTFAQAVTELNGLSWPPDLSVGQSLRMPPCPAR